MFSQRATIKGTEELYSANLHTSLYPRKTSHGAQGE